VTGAGDRSPGTIGLDASVSRRVLLKALGAGLSAIAGGCAPLRQTTMIGPPAQPVVRREERPLGSTGISAATIGFGAMITRDPDVIRYAVDHGVNYVDTADCYMGGENERIVGRALEGIRDRVILATKVHIAPVEQMIRSMENSLRSLRTDRIDIMQLHGISAEAHVTDGYAREALQKFLDQGKIRFPGVTTHGGQEEVLRAVIRHGFYRTALVAYNFRSAGSLSETIREAGAAGIGVIGMKTQAGGYSAPGALSPHQAALAWVLANPGVTTTIPSMVAFSQVDENLGAGGKRLGWGERKALHRYAEAIGGRHCGLCGNCGGGCPQGVEVPSVLRALTYLEGYRQRDLARRTYRGLPVPGNAAPCAACTGCAVTCRLGLPVRALAERAHRLLA